MFSLGGALCEKLSGREANENDRLILFYSRWIVVGKVHYLLTNRDWKLCYWIIDAISLCLQWIEFKLRSLVAYSNVLWLYLHKSLYKMYVEKMMTLNRYICVHTPHNGFAKTHNYISRLEAKIIFDGKVNSRLFPILMGIIVSSAFSVLRAVKLITKSSLSACFNNTIRLKAYRAYIFSNPTFWLTL